MKEQAIFELYPNIKRVDRDKITNEFTCYDESGNIVDNIDMTAVDNKATELETVKANEVQAKEDLKASAKAKLIAGEPLTEDEANTIVL